MIDMTTIFLFSIATGLVYLIYLLKKESVDEEKIRLKIESDLTEKFQEHLSTSNKSFLDLADQNFQNHNDKAKQIFSENSSKVEKDVKDLKDKMNSLALGLKEAVGGINKSGNSLNEHINNLSSNLQAWNQAMASNKVRGDLGEEALEQILTDSGLIEGKNYYLQKHEQVDGVIVKPDVVIELANGGNMVIDSKFPYTDFKKAVEEEDPKRQEEHYKNHANAVLGHVKSLSKKNYFSYLNSSPDYTVLYLNSVIYYYHALRLIPDFVDQARKLKIVIATPEIIIPLLSGVMTQWKEHRMMAEMQNVTNEVSNLHNRLKAFMAHIDGISNELGKAGAKVRDVIGSYNRSVLPSIRRVERLSGQQDKIIELSESNLIGLNVEEKNE